MRLQGSAEFLVADMQKYQQEKKVLLTLSRHLPVNYLFFQSQAPHKANYHSSIPHHSEIIPVKTNLKVVYVVLRVKASSTISVAIHWWCLPDMYFGSVLQNLVTINIAILITYYCDSYNLNLQLQSQHYQSIILYNIYTCKYTKNGIFN